MDGSTNINDGNASGQPTGDTDGGNRKPIGASEPIAGAIDPALARTAAGGPARTGTITASPGAAGEPAAKRPRGRPPGSGNNAKKENTVEASAPASPASPAKEKSPKPIPININGLEKILLSIHEVLAATVSIPDLRLDPKEAKDLSDAIAAVGEQYLIVLNPKHAAWLDLSRAIGCIYGPRAVSIYMAAQARQPVKPKPNPNNGAERRPPPPPQQDLNTMQFDPGAIKVPN